MWQDSNVGNLHGHDEWRRLSVTSATGDGWVVGRNDQGQEENSGDHKHGDSVEDTLTGSENGTTWVLNLGSETSNGLDTTKGVNDTRETLPEGSELPQTTSGQIFVERTRFVPVLEPDNATFWTTARSDNNRNDDQTNQQQQLEHGKGEFNLTVESDTPRVRGNNHHDDDGDPDTLRQVSPVRDNHSSSRDLTRHDSPPNTDPAVSEPQGRIDKLFQLSDGGGGNR
ncbi:hypothetical protein WICPIJ_002335 [Wickerhamomyces pijperi]|uniref:Uncharacterized protein n=1 Tax=Wickerhamomyces pijperi TaxID=599730 RepID=A0A9P8TQA4_WICPI|nr:hypothetical protein WICPIJ_002335 [Wickerhamomyces pijperi]